MVDADEVRVPVTADDAEFERTLRKVEQRLDRFEKDAEKRSQRGGAKRGAFLGGAVGGAVGGAIGSAVSQSPVGQALGGIFTTIVSAIALPILISFLPLIKKALEFITNPKVQEGLKDTGSFLAGGVEGLVGGDDISGQDVLAATAISAGLGSRFGPGGALIGGGFGLAISGGRFINERNQRRRLVTGGQGPSFVEGSQNGQFFTELAPGVANPKSTPFIQDPRLEKEFSFQVNANATVQDPDTVFNQSGTARRNSTNPTGGVFG